MTPVELSRTVQHAVRRAVDVGELRVAVPARVVVERPGPGGCGDYATGVALHLARPAGRPPRQVAEVLRRRLLAVPGVAAVEVTGPGFLNISLDGRRQVVAVVREILRNGPVYGHVEPSAVEDEPDGAGGDRSVTRGGTPLLLRVAPGVRAAVVADSVVRILRSQGVSVRLRYEDPAGPDPAWTALGIAPAPASGPSPASTPGAGQGPEGAAGPDPGLDPVPASGPLVRPVPASTAPLHLGLTAGRWALLYPAPHDRPRIGTEHLAQREDNPLFRVQYVHARTRALVRNAADLGFTADPGDPGDPAEPCGSGVTTAPDDPRTAGEAPDRPRAATSPTAGVTAATTVLATTAQARPPAAAVSLAVTPPAGEPVLSALCAALADHPVVLATAARHRAPDRLARHLVRIADAFLRFQEAGRILPSGDEKPSAAHRARLALAEATGTVLAGGLALLGIDAPDHI